MINQIGNTPNNLNPQGKRISHFDGKDHVLINNGTNSRVEYQGDGIVQRTNGAVEHMTQPSTGTTYVLTGSPSGYALSDNFNRPDDEFNLGFSAPIGCLWNEFYGTFGITGNQAYLSSSVTGVVNLAIQNGGIMNGDLYVTLTGEPGQVMRHGLSFLFESDGSYGFAFMPDDVGYYGFYLVTNGITSPLFSTIAMVHAEIGDMLHISITGDFTSGGYFASAYINDTYFGSTITTPSPASTYYGLICQNYDDAGGYP